MSNVEHPCDLCGRTLLSGEHGPGLCSAPFERPRWFKPAGEPSLDELLRTLPHSAVLPYALRLQPPAGERERQEAIRAAVVALRACGDPWGLDADRLEQAESPKTLAARVDAALEDVGESYHRGYGDRGLLGRAHLALRTLGGVLRPPGRFLYVDPEAVPWRERAEQEPLAQALAVAGATDAEAADMFASTVGKMRREIAQLCTRSAVPFSFRVSPGDGPPTYSRPLEVSLAVPSEPGVLRCSFRYADAAGVFRQCEDGPAPGGERCEEHEKEMARLTAATRKSWASDRTGLLPPGLEVELVPPHAYDERPVMPGRCWVCNGVPGGYQHREAAPREPGKPRLAWKRAPGALAKLGREALRRLVREVAEGLERERALRGELSAVRTPLAGVWLWQGDKGDGPGSLSCPVVMSAERLRGFLAEGDGIERAAAELLHSLGEYVRQTMSANREWASGVAAVEAALLVRRRRRGTLTPKPEGPRGPSENRRPILADLPGPDLRGLCDRAILRSETISADVLSKLQENHALFPDARPGARAAVDEAVALLRSAFPRGSGPEPGRSQRDAANAVADALDHERLLTAAYRALLAAKKEAYRAIWALDAAERDVAHAGEYEIHPSLAKLPALREEVREAREAVQAAEGALRALGGEP